MTTTITVRIEEVERALEIARFHFRALQAEYEKVPPDQDRLALEAYFTACLHLGGAVFYTLVSSDQDPASTFRDKVASWKAELRTTRPADYKFFFRMVEHRDTAVLAATVNTYVSLGPALDIVASWGLPFSHIEAPDRAPVMISKLKLDGAEVIPLCERFLRMLDELVQHCKA